MPRFIALFAAALIPCSAALADPGAELRRIESEPIRLPTAETPAPTVELTRRHLARPDRQRHTGAALALTGLTGLVVSGAAGMTLAATNQVHAAQSGMVCAGTLGLSCEAAEPHGASGVVIGGALSAGVAALGVGLLATAPSQATGGAPRVTLGGRF